MNKKEKTNYNLVNILKFIFSIFVISSHTKLTRNVTNHFIANVITLIINCSVPFFFLSMGYSLADRIDFYNCNERQLKRLKFVIIGIIKKYLLWSLIYLPLALVEYFQTGNSIIYCFFSYLKGLFLKGEHYNSWMLWYLLSFIYATGFIYACLKAKIKFKLVGAMCILIGLLSIALKYNSLYNIAFTSAFLNKIVNFIKLTLDNGRIFTGFLFIYLGIILNKTFFKKTKILIALLIGLLCWVCNVGVVKSIGVVFISVSIFLLSAKAYLFNENNKICDGLRDMSSLNYYTHMYVFTAYYYLMYKVPTYTVDCFVIVTIITCAISFICLTIKNKVIAKLF